MRYKPFQFDSLLLSRSIVSLSDTEKGVNRLFAPNVGECLPRYGLT